VKPAKPVKLLPNVQKPVKLVKDAKLANHIRNVLMYVIVTVIVTVLVALALLQVL
jgi:hypothetical protein